MADGLGDGIGDVAAADGKVCLDEELWERGGGGWMGGWEGEMYL
jgi:hypothetical protein